MIRSEDLLDSAGDIEKADAALTSYPIDENLFYSAPSQPLAENNATEIEGAEDTTYQHSAVEEFPPPPDFRSLFTLIEDPETGEHHHPTVHYIFSDDDPEILTSAALEALDKDTNTTQSPTQQHDLEERCVVVDIAADGTSVISASSMSTDWQAVKTAISEAPSWSAESKSTDRGLMLKISGQESMPKGGSKEEEKRQQEPKTLDGLVNSFSERLSTLDEVIGRTQAAQMVQ